MYQGLAYQLAQIMPRATATGLFSCLFTAQEPAGTFGPSGAPSGAFSDVAGLVNIACMQAVTSEIRITATEEKSVSNILSLDSDHVLLDAYYPTLEAGWRAGWRCQITLPDGETVETRDILGVEHDSQTQMTRVAVRTASI